MGRHKGPRPTLPKHADDFLNDLGCTLNTELTYRTGLITFQRFAEAAGLASSLSPLAPEALTNPIIGDFYTWLRRARYANATIRLYLSSAIQYMTWLEGGGLLPAGVRIVIARQKLEQKTGTRGRRIRPERRGSDDADGALLGHYWKLLRDEEPEPRSCRRLILMRNHAVMIVLYVTAGRAAEIASLQRADVAEGRATQAEIVGKGGRRRLLVFTDAAQQAITAYLRERTDTNRALFVSHRAHRSSNMTTATMWRIVNDAAKAVYGVDDQGRSKRRVGPHSFRHLRAQHLSDDGMPITSLQTMLGHASIVTTRDIYAPKTPAAKLLNELEMYSRDPLAVVERGNEAIEQERQSEQR